LQSKNFHWQVEGLDQAYRAIGFYLSNRVTGTLESSSILICLEAHMGFYTREGGKMPT